MNSYNAHNSLCAKCYFNYILPRDFVVTVHKLMIVLCDKVFVSACELICTGNINLSMQSSHSFGHNCSFTCWPYFKAVPCVNFLLQATESWVGAENKAAYMYIINTYRKFSLMKYCFCYCVFILLCWFCRENNTVSLDNFLLSLPQHQLWWISVNCTPTSP